MPNIQVNKSAEKRVRQDKAKRARNRVIKGYTRDMMRTFEAEMDVEKACGMLPHAYSILDKAVKKGVMHRRTAARHKSRMALRVQRIAAAEG